MADYASLIRPTLRPALSSHCVLFSIFSWMAEHERFGRGRSSRLYDTVPRHNAYGIENSHLRVAARSVVEALGDARRRGSSGRRRLLPIYRAWRTEVAGKSPRMMTELIEMVGTNLDINAGYAVAGTWPVTVPADTPLVMVANHPFGIGDGIAILALAEQLGR